ncbi:MAG: tetratricopeptide repeat protein [Chlorobiaceae bacterium]
MKPYLSHSKTGIQRPLVSVLLAGLTLLTSCNRSSNDLKTLQQQVWKNPKDAGAYMLLGNGYARSERYSEAADAYKSALAINPKLEEANHALGAVAFNQKNYAESLKYFQKHLEYAPKDSLTLYDIGNAYMQLKQFDKAAESYSAAIDNSESFTEAHYNLAICYLNTGQRAEAQTIYEWLLKKNNYLAVSLQKHFTKEKRR